MLKKLTPYLRILFQDFSQFKVFNENVVKGILTTHYRSLGGYKSFIYSAWAEKGWLPLYHSLGSTVKLSSLEPNSIVIKQTVFY